MDIIKTACSYSHDMNSNNKLINQKNYDEDVCESKKQNLMKNVCNKYRKILARHQKFQPNQYICQLAHPRYHYRKYKSAVLNRKQGRTIEIIRLDERISTRLTQLSYPLVRQLMFVKNNYKKYLETDRYHHLNRQIRKSLLSLYSRLANVSQPEKKIYPRKWTKEEWKHRRRKFRKLAKPKKILEPPPIVRPQMKLEDMKRLKKLSKPKPYEPLPENKWILTPAMKKYKMSARMQTLAARKNYNFVEPLPLPKPITPETLKFKITPRLRELAMHREKQLKASDQKENPFVISPNALKAKPSARTKELAEPKEYETPPIREDPFKISPNALKAKPSERIIELAKPKNAA